MYMTLTNKLELNIITGPDLAIMYESFTAIIISLKTVQSIQK